MTRWAKRVNKQKSVTASSWSHLRAGIAGRANASVRRSADGGEANNNNNNNNQDVNGFLEFLEHRRKPFPHGRQRGSSEEQELRDAVTTALKKTNRREGRRIKRQNNKKSNMICFNCRKPGHGLADCPKADDEEMGRGICFRCGSTEHELQRCRAKVDPAMGDYPYAKCFICGKLGHLSKCCPDNPKGLYAAGGCCRICGSVEHFQKDCPDHQTSTKSMTLGRLSDKLSADHEDVGVSVPHVERKKVKTVVMY